MTDKVIDVDVEKIRPNLRLIYHEEAIEGLCLHMERGGGTEPIEIWFDGEAFRIRDGEKRWRACKKLGIRRVKACLLKFKETE